MKMTEWTKWKKGGLAAAVAGALVVGMLAVAPVAVAQTPTPTAPSGTATAQTAKTRPAGRGGQRGGPGAHLSVVATALGIDEATLQTELQAGKTISDVAALKGVALSVVSNALLTEEKTRLAQDVTDGKITQAQADERLANAPTRITEMLTKVMPARSQGRGPQGGGPQGRGPQDRGPQGGAPGQGGPRGPRQPGATQPGTPPAATPAPTA